MRLQFIVSILSLLLASGAWAQSGGSPSYPEQAGSAAGGGLFTSGPPELMQPGEWMVYLNDYLDASDFGTTDDWTVTAIDLATGGTGTVALVSDTALGLLLFSPEAAANTGSQVQLSAGAPGEFILAAAGRTIIYEARVAVATPQIQDFVIGLVTTQEDPGTSGVIDGNGAWQAGVTDAVVFNCNDADAGIVEAAYEDSVGGLVDVGDVNAAAFANGSYHRYGIRIVGTDYVEWYIDGVRQQSLTLAGNLANEMALTFANVGDAAAETMTVDYVIVAQTRE